MVSIRLGVFVYAIIFMLLHFGAYSQQDREKMVGRVGGKLVERVTLARQEKNTFNVVPSHTKVIINSKIIGGRKMMNEEFINGVEERVSKKALSSSNTNPRNGNHKDAKKSKKIDYHDDHEQNHDLEVKMKSTFMVMNADYHVPRSHPPRNN